MVLALQSCLWRQRPRGGGALGDRHLDLQWPAPAGPGASRLSDRLHWPLQRTEVLFYLEPGASFSKEKVRCQQVKDCRNGGPLGSTCPHSCPFYRWAN